MDNSWRDGPGIPLYKYVLNPSSLILSEPGFSLVVVVVVVEGVGHNLNILQSDFKIYLCQVMSLGKCSSHQAGPWPTKSRRVRGWWRHNPGRHHPGNGKTPHISPHLFSKEVYSVTST